MNITIDLGNYNTIITYDEAGLPASEVLKGAARNMPVGERAILVPSVINLEGGRVAIGKEVTRAGLYGKDSTFRDLRDYILHSTPMGLLVDGRRVSHKEAASIFLNEIVRRMRDQTSRQIDVSLIHPTYEGEDFVNWVKSVSLSEARSVTLVDEDTAVALGYGVNLFKDDTIVFFDFGFSSIRARLVKFNWLGRESYTLPLVKASAMYPVGSADIKQRIIRQLEFQGYSHDEKTGRRHVLHESSFSTEEFIAYAEREDLGALVDNVVERLWEEAEARGIDKSIVKKVCLIGGATRIPSVKAALKRHFGEKLLGDMPETSAGLGGITFLGDRPTDDMIRSGYSMRVRDPVTGQYHFPLVVERFTRFPTKNPTARYIVNTFYDGQYELHLELFKTGKAVEHLGSREIIIDEAGKISFVTSKTEDVQEPVGEPFTIPVSPAGRVGERRILLEFRVDNQKRLTCTAKDLREDKILWDEKPLMILA